MMAKTQPQTAAGVAVDVLCPGPSLATHDTFDGDVRIGVNRAVHHATCDWWVFCDWQMFRDYRPGYMPGLFMLKLAKQDLEKKGHDLSGYTIRLFDDHKEHCPSRLGWTMYSMTAAMVFAESLGATNIRLFGVDMTDEPDWDGRTDDRNRRSDERWREEGKILTDVTAWLNERGVEVSGGPA